MYTTHMLVALLMLARAQRKGVVLWLAMQLVYKRAAQALDKLQKRKGSLKSIIFGKRSRETLSFRKRVYAVAAETLKCGFNMPIGIDSFETFCNNAKLCHTGCGQCKNALIPSSTATAIHASGVMYILPMYNLSQSHGTLVLTAIEALCQCIFPPNLIRLRNCPEVLLFVGGSVNLKMISHKFAVSAFHKLHSRHSYIWTYIDDMLFLICNSVTAIHM